MAVLKEVRIKKKMTQEDLATKVGVTRQTISMIEQGRNEPSVALAKKIGEVLKIRWYKLFE